MTSRARVMTAMVCALLLAACTSAGTPSATVSVGATRSSGSPTGGVSPSAPASESPSSPSPRPTATGTPDLHVVATLPGVAGDLAVGPDGVLYAAVAGPPGRIVVVRFDPASGAMTRSGPMPGSATHTGELAVADGTVWVADQDPRDQAASTSVFELDVRTLAREGSLTMPGPPVAAVAVPAGVWIAAGTHILLLDPPSGRVLRTAPVGGHITRMAADPEGERLYVSTDTVRDQQNHVIFVEASATTGAALASARDIGFFDLNGPSGVAATEQGVWVSMPTGNNGILQFHRSLDLSVVPGGSGAAEAYGIEGSNGVRGSFAGEILWVSTDPTQPLFCADPSTGKFRGQVAIPRSSLVTSDVVSAPSGIYVALTHERARLMRITPPPAC